MTIIEINKLIEISSGLDEKANDFFSLFSSYDTEPENIYYGSSFSAYSDVSAKLRCIAVTNSNQSFNEIINSVCDIFLLKISKSQSIIDSFSRSKFSLNQLRTENKSYLECISILKSFLVAN